MGNYKGKNHLINKDIKCKDDETTHIYTLIVTPDNKYKVLIDNAEEAAGALEGDWDFLPAKKIKDPEASKPSQDEWDEREDIADPDATKPDDWDDDMDGEWEPPMVDNPDFKGDWKAPMIKNPAYKGKWVHPEIDNPDYAEDSDIYSFADFGRIGLDLWQVKSGTIFSNFMIADDISAADAAAKELLTKIEAEAAAKKEEEDAAAAAEPADDEEGEIELPDDEDYPDEYPEDDEDELEDLLADHDEL